MKTIFLSLIFPALFLWYFAVQPQHKYSGVSQPEDYGLEITTIASSLNVPWEISWGPDNQIWITEQKGIVSRIDPQTGGKDTLLQLADVWHVRTAGLLGMVLHPDMKAHPYIFLNYTFLKGEKPFSRLVRYTWKKDTLINPRVILEVPGNNGHNGSRLAFSKGKLYWATGDAISTTNSQDISSPNGKILRFNTDGSIPHDNPIKGKPFWAMGFRNIQGMTFSASGQLYISEHGDATDDEISLITKGKNYGWPVIQGFADTPEEASFKQEKSTLDPLKAWTPTIGPAGIDYYFSNKIPGWKNSLLLVSLKGKSLRVLRLSADGKQITDEKILFENQYGRLRDLCISPSGDVYISTSNRDWNPSPGFPLPADDRIIKLTFTGKIVPSSETKSRSTAAVINPPANLYTQYCESCHKENGLGVTGLFPSLKGSDLVRGSEIALAKKILKGSSGPVIINGVKYDSQMPSFAFLKDVELANILRYIRSFNSSDTTGISPDLIKKARKD